MNTNLENKAIAAAQAVAIAAKHGGFKTKAAQKDVCHTLQSIYDGLRSAAMDCFSNEWRRELYLKNVDFPYDLSKASTKRLAAINHYGDTSNDAATFHSISARITNLYKLRADAMALAILPRVPANERPLVLKSGVTVSYAQMKPVIAMVKEFMADADAKDVAMHIKREVQAITERYAERKRAVTEDTVAFVARNAEAAMVATFDARNHKVAKALIERLGEAPACMTFGKSNGIEGTFRFECANGRIETVRLDVIGAGGYNIQCYHHRILIK